MSIKTHLNFLELLYKKKENFPCDFLIDEIDVDSYCNFLDVYVVQNRDLRLKKGLFRETYSIKDSFYSISNSQICQNSPAKFFIPPLF